MLVGAGQLAQATSPGLTMPEEEDQRDDTRSLPDVRGRDVIAGRLFVGWKSWGIEGWRHLGAFHAGEKISDLYPGYKSKLNTPQWFDSRDDDGGANLNSITFSPVK